MEFDIYQFTHSGGAAENQDAAYAGMEGGTFYAALCDGMSGMPQGKAAARICIESIIGGIQGKKSAAETVEEALQGAHRALLELQKADPACARAKTTGCALIAGDGSAAFATVGDSRVYVFTGDTYEASRDHSVAYAAYARGELPYADIRMYSGRSALTACLGDERDISPKGREIPIKPGDAILLCSDGFWEYVYETEMQIDLCKASSAKSWAQSMLLRLVTRSHLAGDNCTCIACIAKDEERRTLEPKEEPDGLQ